MTVADAGADAGADKGIDQGADKGAAKDAGTILNAGGDATGGGDAAAAAAAAAKAAGIDKGKADAGISDADKGAWPADWRAKLAGEDKKALSQLERYGSPAEIYKKTRELEAKFSSGEYKRDLPKDATAEQVTEWRKERGIPENEEGYVTGLKLPDGVVLGEADKPIVSAFAKAALAGNVDPGQFSGLVAQYYAMQDEMAAQREEADDTYKDESKAVLVEELGADYKRTVTSVNNMIATWPKEIAENVLSARGSDGRLLGDNPAFIKQLASIARELNPAATLIPAGGSDGAKGIEEQIAEIRKFAQDNPDAYDRDHAMQKRQVDLIAAQQKLQARRPAA